MLNNITDAVNSFITEDEINNKTNQFGESVDKISSNINDTMKSVKECNDNVNGLIINSDKSCNDPDKVSGKEVCFSINDAGNFDELVNSTYHLGDNFKQLLDTSEWDKWKTIKGCIEKKGSCENKLSDIETSFKLVHLLNENGDDIEKFGEVLNTLDSNIITPYKTYLNRLRNLQDIEPSSVFGVLQNYIKRNEITAISESVYYFILSCI